MKNSGESQVSLSVDRWTVQSVNNSTSSFAGGSQGSSTGGGGSQMRKMSKSPSCIWQLNIYHIITGELRKFEIIQHNIIFFILKSSEKNI